MLIIHTPDRRNSSTKGSEGNKAGYGVSGARTVYEGLEDRVKIKGENIGVVFCILDFRREGKERGYTLVVSRDCPQMHTGNHMDKDSVYPLNCQKKRIFGQPVRACSEPLI